MGPGMTMDCEDEIKTPFEIKTILIYDQHTLDLMSSKKWNYAKKNEFGMNDANLNFNPKNGYDGVLHEMQNKRLAQVAGHIRSSQILNNISELFDVCRLDPPIYDKDDRTNIASFYDFIKKNG